MAHPRSWRPVTLLATLVLLALAQALRPQWSGIQTLSRCSHKPDAGGGPGRLPGHANSSSGGGGAQSIFHSLQRQREGRARSSGLSLSKLQGSDRDRGTVRAAAARGQPTDSQRQQYGGDVPEFEFAPAMTLQKYESMQSKRVEVTIQYAGFGGYKMYGDAAEHIIKEHFPDVLIKREELPVTGSRSEGAFEILVDDQVVVCKRRDRSSVYLPMAALREAVKSRRKERRHGKAIYGERSTFGGGSGDDQEDSDDEQD